jgi:NAD(P)-dependent dehydrogenase (short-subunit alcohol dehydrogenase family)
MVPGRESALIIGGSSGIGREVARALASRGDAVIVAGRERARAEAVAREFGGSARGLALDLTQPETVAASLSDIGSIRSAVLTAIERVSDSPKRYDVAGARRLVTMKLLGYTAVAHAIAPLLVQNAALVLFGGLSKDRPVPSSTTLSTVNAAVAGLVHTLAVELAPVRVNGIHPEVVGDSPAWAGKTEVLERLRARTPTGRLATMQDVAAATLFLLDNPAANGINLDIDGGWMLL